MFEDENSPLEDGTKTDTSASNPEFLNFSESEDDLQDDPPENEAASEPNESEEAETEASESEASDDDPEIALDGGETIKLSELKRGHLLDRDYRQSAAELEERRNVVQGQAETLQKTINGVVDFFARFIPDAPDANLAMQNPAEYVQRQAAHENAVQQITAIIEAANAANGAVDTLSNEQRRDIVARESERLIAAFPDAGDPKKREVFFEGAFSAARELGFGEEEMRGVVDHRIFALAHYARIGLAAEKSRKSAERKVQNVPPVSAPKKARAADAEQARKQQSALSRLRKTGSLKDALAVDFD